MSSKAGGGGCSVRAPAAGCGPRLPPAPDPGPGVFLYSCPERNRCVGLRSLWLMIMFTVTRSLLQSLCLESPGLLTVNTANGNYQHCCPGPFLPQIIWEGRVGAIPFLRLFQFDILPKIKLKSGGILNKTVCLMNSGEIPAKFW